MGILNWISGGDQFASLITASLGAFAGAAAAYTLERRSRRKEALVDDVRNINAAIMTAFNILCAHIRLKKQHVDELKRNYDSFYAAIRNAEQQQTTFSEPMDCHTIDPMHMPLDILRQQVFEKISGSGEVQAWMIHLNESVVGLQSSLEQRNEWLKARRHYALNQEHEIENYHRFVREYAGLPLNGRMIDHSYGNLIEAIYSQNKDCIWFARTLLDELMRHGNSLIEKKKTKLRINEVQIPAEDIPNDAAYENLRAMYRRG